MRFISLVKKELIHNIRDKRAMFLMVVFPIIMIVILGAAFSNSFSSSNIISNINVKYQLSDNAETNEGFISFTESIKESLDIKFVESNNENITLQELKDGKIDVYLDFSNSKKVRIVTNDLRPYNANLVKTVIDSYLSRQDLINTVLQVNPSKVKDVIPNENYEPNFISDNNIETSNGPSARDYYAVTMFTMIILYSTNIGAFGVITENIRKTYQRLMVSNVSKLEYLLAKVVGAFIITCVQVFTVYIFSKYMLNTNWGTKPQYILLISSSLVFMAVSLGIGLTSGIKNPILMATVLNMTIPVFVFFAGGYVPLNIFNSKVINMISNLSPLKWTNQAMFNLIYKNDLSLIPKTITINIIIGMLFLLIPVITQGRRKDVI